MIRHKAYQGNPEGLRRYPHPGKYEGGLLIDEYVDQLSKSGMDDEVGEADTTGWYGLFKGLDVRDLEGFARESGEPLTREEKILIRRSAGVIIHENSQGFVEVIWYDSKTELMETWDKIADEINESMDGGDGG
jgi:hypothetical protein